MAKSNTRIFILSLSVLIVLVLLAIFSAGVPRLSSRAMAQRNQSNTSLPSQQPNKPKRGTLQEMQRDKNGVYSEFNVQVDAVLKGAVPTLSQTNLISVSRLGGMVRYPSGQKVLYRIGNQNMPAIGKRYLFFLKAVKDTEDYEIVTGYEIGSTSVLPLDFGSQFQAFNGKDSVVFLNAVRESISNKN